MDPLMIVLRILHIFFGMMWLGQIFMVVLVTEPGQRSYGLDTEKLDLQRRIAGLPVMIPIMLILTIVTVGSGMAMTLILRWSNLGAIFTTAWGWAIITGLATTIAFLIVVWGITTPADLRLRTLVDSLNERSPTPEEDQRLEKHIARDRTLGRLGFVLLLITVIAMASARYL